MKGRTQGGKEGGRVERKEAGRKGRRQGWKEGGRDGRKEAYRR